MNNSFTMRWKIFLVAVVFITTVIGFMIKLPSAFRHIDKELHAAFYFTAAAFLNFLFAKKKLVRHLAIFFTLFLFSMGVEYAQEYSNRFFRKRIHGRFDPEDLQWNLKGLIAFSVLWFVYMGFVLLHRKATEKYKGNDLNKVF